jgi:ABC-type multidrug transport system ATPase subunit
MSRHILDALMRLFALITLREEGVEKGREVVALFLRVRLSKESVTEWLAVFDGYLGTLGGAVESREVKGLKRTALRSTKVLRTCTDINRDLQASEKALVFIRVLEFEQALLEEGGESDALSRELIDLVSDVFAIRESEKRCYETLVFNAPHWPVMTQRYHEAFLIGDQPQLGGVVKAGWSTPLACFRHPESQVVFLKPMGAGNIQINGEVLDPDRVQPFTPGSTLRHGGAAPLHFVDIQRSFMEEDNIPELSLEISEVSHWFRYPEQQALHPFRAKARSGMLVGVMGASGSGKSTLLNLLAGTAQPTFGSITIDGIEVSEERARSWIGLVPQEDHLLPELTVKENLYYAARLAFAQDNTERSEERVEACLKQLGLWEARDLPVGDALRKTISGGQRKRLNIAMELIREPRVLLVDEPTSGLSSKDSELIMDLMKQMTYGGTLVIAVIHQPSGDIFRSFDALWVLDHGGYPVFTGRPLDALTHFRSMVNHFDADHVACGICGHVNPEQIFDIIDVPVLDSRGQSTGERRISPKEWNDFYNVLLVPQVEAEMENAGEDTVTSPSVGHRPPHWFTQWGIQASRDVVRKWKNRQYLLINLLEAPVLALSLAFMLRASEGGAAYTFGNAVNIPHFLFISVIVAIFMGLTVSAEELFRDRLMRKREHHLRLDWGAYLTAKCAVLFGISALQTLLFAGCSYPLLELPGHFFSYWFTLFSVAASANLFGLIISLLFNSVRVIYLAIPLFIIPQLMLGGAIVTFDQLHRVISRPSGVSPVGQFMISRWGFESLTTLYTAQTEYGQALFDDNQALAQASYHRDRWCPEMDRQILSAARGNTDALKTVAHEWQSRFERGEVQVSVAFHDGLDETEKDALLIELERFRDGQRQAWRKAKEGQDEVLRERGWAHAAESKRIKSEQFNQVLMDWTTQDQVLNKGIAWKDQKLWNTRDALYAEASAPGMGAFHAATSRLNGVKWPKHQANWAVLWLTTFFMMVVLVVQDRIKSPGRPPRT